MDVQAIVYVSETGYTAAYARLLSGKTGLPAYTLPEANEQLAPGAPVIYMGWLMAGSVKDCKKAAKRYKIRCVCGVGLGDTGAQDDAARKACALPADVPVFTVQGGMALDRLRGPYRLAIRLLTKGMAAKKNRTPGEERMLQLLQTGGNYVSEENLSAVLRWYGA